MKFDPKKYPFTVGDEIQSICNPLFQSTDIHHFEYVRSYSNGSFLSLTSNLPWLEHYIKKEYYNCSFSRHLPDSYKEGYIFLSLKKGTNRCVADAESSFNIYHTIALVEPNQTSCDFYIFGAEQKDSHMLNFYINNLDLLKRFTYYFQDKAKDIIAHHTKDKFKTPLILADEHHPQSNSRQDKIEINLPHEHYPLFKNRNVCLTWREKECIQWLSQGKSSEEIGMILNLSKRTVEAHIVNAKKKMGCYKTTQLISLAYRFSLI